MRKEIIAVAIAALLTVSSAAVLAGCGEGDNKQATTAPTTVAATTQATTQATTKSSAGSSSSDANSSSDNSVVSSDNGSSSSSAVSSNSSDNASSESSNGNGLVKMDSNGIIAVNALGLSTDTCYAVENGATQGNDGLFNVYDVYDYDSQYYGTVYVHFTGSPVYTSTEAFENAEKSQISKSGNADDSDENDAGNNEVSYY